MSKKICLALVVIVVLAVALVSVVYFSHSPSNVNSVLTVGVKAGDVFTYQLVGFVDSYVAGDSIVDFVIPDNVVDINNTKYYRVEITKVEVPIISYILTWEFKNGTTGGGGITSMINIENGLYIGYYWDIYASGLTVGSLSRPGSSEDQTIISETKMRSYPNGDREINFLRAEYEAYDVDDQTYTSKCYVLQYVHFDKQIGIMTDYRTVSDYNLYQVIVTVEYTLVGSNILQIP